MLIGYTSKRNDKYQQNRTSHNNLFLLVQPSDSQTSVNSLFQHENIAQTSWEGGAAEL